MPLENRLLDRYRGALLGLAVGDALGGPVEFLQRGSFPPVTGMRGGGVHRLQPGEWTDDTAMALALAESLIERKGFDPVDQLSRYLRWYREGDYSCRGTCFDIGLTTRRSLEAFARTGEPFPGPTDERTAGNGSLMRLAPVPLAFRRQPVLALRLAGDSSRTTHGAPQAVDACRYFAGLILGALNGVSKEALLRPSYSPVGDAWDPDDLHPAVAAVARGSFREKPPEAIVADGYVVRTLEAALWAFYRSEGFREAVLLAVNLGGDADTVGAVTGQLAGAYYGARAIPVEWLRALCQETRIRATADRLLELSRVL